LFKMKIPMILISVFAVLTLCLPLVAVGSSLPAIEPDKKTTQTAPKQQSAQAVTQTEAPQVAQKNSTEIDTIEAADTFRILNLSTGKVQKVKRIDYVRGAVCAEMPPAFHTQALTAQAVAANTFAVRNKAEQAKKPDPNLKGADFSADPDHWKGYVTEAQAKERFGDKFDVYWDKICKAADLGSTYVMVYDNEPIVAAYHSISAGQTEYASNVWQGSARALYVQPQLQLSYVDFRAELWRHPRPQLRKHRRIHRTGGAGKTAQRRQQHPVWKRQKRVASYREPLRIGLCAQCNGWQ